MGVQGLMTLLINKRDECSEIVDLIQLAIVRNGIELLVDLYSFQSILVRAVYNALAFTNYHGCLNILSAEYQSIDAYVGKFVHDLSSLGISLVFFVDPHKCSSDSITAFKMDTWISRAIEGCQKIRNILCVCSRAAYLSQLTDDSFINSAALDVQFRATLRENGCEIICIAAGEADQFIASQLIQRPKALAVFSNDSDFSIFKDCAFIPKSLFDLRGDIGLMGTSVLPKCPQQLLCGIVRASAVQRMLKRRCPDLRNAVEFSRQFYSPSAHLDSTSHDQGATYDLIANRIRMDVYPGFMLSMYRGFYWQRLLLEDVTLWPSAGVLMAPLRRYLYGMLLPRHHSSVQEYCHTCQEDVHCFTNDAIFVKNLPTLHQIFPGQVFRNLRTFHMIMSHLEEHEPKKTWFDKYGRKTGFTCYILRYFLLLNWGQLYAVTEMEFLSLIATAFGATTESDWQDVPLCPDNRCVSMASLFQEIYRTAYLFLGSMLFLRDEFPLPKEIFCGSMWTILYAISGSPASAHPSTCRDELALIGDERIHAAVTGRDAILHDKRHIITNLVDGCFQFHDRMF